MPSARQLGCEQSEVFKCCRSYATTKGGFFSASIVGATGQRGRNAVLSCRQSTVSGRALKLCPKDVTSGYPEGLLSRRLTVLSCGALRQGRA